MDDLKKIFSIIKDGILVNECEMKLDHIVDDGDAFGIMITSNTEPIFISMNKESFIEACTDYLNDYYSEQMDMDDELCMCPDCVAERLVENGMSIEIPEFKPAPKPNVKKKHKEHKERKESNLEIQNRCKKLDKLFENTKHEFLYLFYEKQSVEYKGKVIQVEANKEIVAESKTELLKELKQLLKTDYETIFPYKYTEDKECILEFAFIPKKKKKDKK